MRRCHGKKKTKEVFGNNCAALARLARALLSVQTGLDDPTDWRFRCLTRGWGSGKQRELLLRQALPELSPRAHASNVAWPPHTADIHTLPGVLTLKFWKIVAALEYSWAGSEGRTHCRETKSIEGLKVSLTEQDQYLWEGVRYPARIPHALGAEGSSARVSRVADTALSSHPCPVLTSSLLLVLCQNPKACHKTVSWHGQTGA